MFEEAYSKMPMLADITEARIKLARKFNRTLPKQLETETRLARARPRAAAPRMTKEETRSMSDRPTFVATFDDGETTRMTVWQNPDHAKLDVGRGVRLARHAYCSRKRVEKAAPIARAQYEDAETRAVLKTYTAKELAEPVASKAA
jgi:hypothetical protein